MDGHDYFEENKATNTKIYMSKFFFLVSIVSGTRSVTIANANANANEGCNCLTYIYTIEKIWGKYTCINFSFW